VELRGKTGHTESQVVLGAGHTRASLGANWAGARPGFPSQHTRAPESPLILLAFLPHCVHQGLVVLIIPLLTLQATSVFHVQTHREPRAALTGLLRPEWLWQSRVREEAKWKLVRRWIYRFVVILQHKTARPTSKQMVKQTHFRFVYLFCPNS
jgi:hypothetical protein